jgi:hypothetical protein
MWYYSEIVEPKNRIHGSGSDKNNGAKKIDKINIRKMKEM